MPLYPEIDIVCNINSLNFGEKAIDMVDRYGHIYQFKESEVRISKKQYPKEAIEIEKPLFNRNMAAHLLLRVVDSGHLN